MEQGADGERVEQPAAQIAVAQLVGILDIIAIVSPALVEDGEAEEFLDGDAPFVERAFGDFLSVAHVVFQPSAIELLQRDALSPIDGFHEPDVFVHLICCHTVFFDAKIATCYAV